MKIFLLMLVCIYTGINCTAQQKVLDSLLNELKQHPQEDTLKLNLLYLVAMAYYYTNPNEGIKKSDEGIRLAYKLQDEVKLGNAISSKGCNYLAEGKNDSCLMLLKTALQIFEKHNYERGESVALNVIGIVQFNTGDYASALNTYKKNQLMAERVNNNAQLTGAFGNIGMVYRVLSNYTEALKYDLKAINMAEKANNKPALISTCGEAGFTYRELKETAKAQEYYQRALNFCIQTGNKREEATILSALGQISIDKKDYQQALSYYQQAISIGNSAGNTQTVAATLGNIGDVYKSIANYSTAVDYYKKALLLYQKLGDKNNTAYILSELGDMYTLTPQQHKKALSYLQQSLALAKEIGSIDRQKTTLGYLSNFYEKQKDYQKALDLNKQANVLQDSTLNDTTKQKITSLEMQYQFSKTEDSVKAITDNQQALAIAEIQKQRIVKKSVMAGAGFLVLASIGGFIFYKRNRDIRTQKNEAELQSQIIDTEMKALRAQMNPHFIFNSLNSIADYIDTNQTRLASDFTIKFARLMRMVLENSEKKEIPLADDLKALELYMQLERFRMQDKFNYEIKVDASIDSENTLVPPLILQPFVENSIWHGFEGKKDNGNIIINIKKEGEMINCIVEDDGIGLSKKNNLSEEKKSLGMKITNDRINIINKLKNANASMKISSKEKGVKAEVRLPLELSF